MAAPAPLDQLPGYRRRFVVTAGADWVRAEMEDDYHCMSVTVRHQGGVASAVDGVMHRAPWSTCPGAQAELARTFTGVALDQFAARGEKARNCTHLHDLATLAAAHAGDAGSIVYDLLVSDPVGGESRAELHRNGETVLSWTLAGFRIVAPPEVAGLGLEKMRPWLDTLDPPALEAARLLRWGVMIAHGRTIPLADQSDASRMPPNCFTFQPETAARAKRIGVIRDFSAEAAEPLDGRMRARPLTPEAPVDPR